MRFALSLFLVGGVFAAAYAADVAQQKAPGACVINTSDLVAQCAAKYAAAGTYYEESKLTMVMDAEGRHKEDKIGSVVAFKRPSTIKVDLSGDVEAVLYLEGRRALYYDRHNDEYVTKELDEASDFVADLGDLKLEFTPAGEDFEAAFRQDAVSISEPKEVTRGDRPAYEVEVKRASGDTDTFVFDRDTLSVVEIKTVTKVETDEGAGTVTYTKSIDKALLDEAPKDAAGKRLDVFSYSPPKTAREIKPKKAAEPDREAKAASTGSAL